MGGALLRTALQALSGPPSADDSRTAAQRRADALVELARQRPHLTLTASLTTLRKEPGAQAGDLDWGQPVPAETVRRIACDAALTPALLGRSSEPLAVGRASRVIPASLRRALAARDGGCRFPGCDRPAAWTDGHHLKHCADGGETSAGNLVLLCVGRITGRCTRAAGAWPGVRSRRWSRSRPDRTRSARYPGGGAAASARRSSVTTSSKPPAGAAASTNR